MTLAESVRERLDRLCRDIREQDKRYQEEWEALGAEEQQRLLAQFTRPDGSLCEHWWQPSVEGWG